MTPCFKSHFSIGKSILTLSEKESEEGPDSIIDICKKNKLDKCVLVEDSMSGFWTAYKNLSKEKIQLIFGLRLSFVNNLNLSPEERMESSHKNIIFANNNEGYKNLIKISSVASTEFYNKEPQIDYNKLKEFWDDKNLSLAIPFYDSYLFNNSLTEKVSIPDFFVEPTYFEENNNHPWDAILSDNLKDFKTEKVKTILYKNKEDFEAWQTFKCITNRSGFRARSLYAPNLEMCCSDEFCFESFLEKVND